MRIQVRLILILGLSLHLWWLADGVRCLWTGRFFGRTIGRGELDQNPSALALADGSFVDYGPWAAWLADVGFDPHVVAPYLIGVGVLGLVGLFLFLQARPVGWALLVATTVLGASRVSLASALAVALLIVLVLPATRRLLSPAASPEGAQGPSNDPA